MNIAPASPAASAPSPLHRLAAGYKFAFLFCFSLLLFIISNLPIISSALVFVFALYKTAGLTAHHIWRQLRPIWWIVLFLAAAQWFYADWQSAFVVIGRLIVMLLLAGLIMLTTSTTAIMEAFERGLRVLQPLGLNPEKTAFVLSLTLRFLPLLAQITQEVREAQKARGLEHSFIATALPVLIRTLKMQEDITAAIEARCYEDAPPPHTLSTIPGNDGK